MLVFALASVLGQGFAQNKQDVQKPAKVAKALGKKSKSNTTVPHDWGDDGWDDGWNDGDVDIPDIPDDDIPDDDFPDDFPDDDEYGDDPFGYDDYYEDLEDSEWDGSDYDYWDVLPPKGVPAGIWMNYVGRPGFEEEMEEARQAERDEAYATFKDCTARERYNSLKESIEMSKTLLDPNLKLEELYGPEVRKAVMYPYFTSMPELTSSKLALRLAKCYGELIDVEGAEKLLGESYKNGTLTAEVALQIHDMLWVYYEVMWRYDEAIGMLYDKFEAEYAARKWNCFALNNDVKKQYIHGFSGKNVSSSNPYVQIFDMRSAQKVYGYYLVPTDQDSACNPSSWTLYAYSDPGSYDDDGDGHRNSQLPEVANRNQVDPSEPDFWSMINPDEWVPISRVRNVRLSEMERDSEGRIYFEAQQAFPDCTHLMLMVERTEGNKSEVRYRNFFPRKSDGNVVELAKTTIDLGDELNQDADKIVLSTNTDPSEAWQLVSDISLTLHHTESDVKPIEDIEANLHVGADGKARYDMSQWWASWEANDRFPFRFGHWCDATISYTVQKGSNTDSRKVMTQSFPIVVKGGVPVISMGDDTGDYVIDYKVEGDTAHFPITIERLDGLRGFAFDVTVKDYSSGKLAERTYSYLAKPNEVDIFNAEGTDVSWVKFGNSDWFAGMKGSIINRQMLKAEINVPVVTIPMSSDATVSVRVLNDYNIYNSNDPHVVADDHYINMYNTVHNTEFNADLLSGTYTVGVKHPSKPRSIKDWQTGDAGRRAELRKMLEDNIEDPLFVDSLLEVELERTMMTFNFDYPSAWGDVEMYFESESDMRKAPELTYKDKHGERIIAQSNFKRTVEFSRDGKKHTLVLSWKDGRFTQRFDFTTDSDVLKGLLCYFPYVVDDDEDKLHEVVFSYGVYDKNRLVEKVVTERKGHFSATTKHLDNKIYIIDNLSYSIEDSNKKTWKCNFRLKSNNFVYSGGQTISFEHSYQPDYECWVHDELSKSNPHAMLCGYKGTYAPLRCKGQYAHISVVDEQGNDLNRSYVRYAYVEEPDSVATLCLGSDADHSPFSQDQKLRGKVTDTSGENIFTIPILMEEDKKYHLFLEVETEKWVYRKTYNTLLFCDVLNGEDFREAIESGNVFTCVLSERKPHEGEYCVQDLWVRDTTYMPLSPQATHFSPITTNMMSYTGCDSLVIDVLMSNEPGAIRPDGYLMSPQWVDPQSPYFRPIENNVKELTPALDENGRAIRWDASRTGFTRDYQLLTCKTTLLQPAKKEDAETPDPYNLVVWKGKLTEVKPDSIALKIAYDTTFGQQRDALACAPAITALNYAKDNSAEISKKAIDALDMEMPELRFGKDMGFAGNIMSAFARLPINGPSCFPFNMMISYENDHYNLRGAFEINSLDFIPGYAAYSESNKFLDAVGKVTDEYNRVKNAIDPDKTTGFDDVFLPNMPSAFHGFKGYFDAGLYYDKKDSTYRPFFNDLVCRFESSCDVRAILPFAGVGSINFGLNAAAYAQFMVSNPAWNDPYLNGRNHLSHFNIYGMMGANVDVKAAVQVGFDFGLVAACAGIRGAAAASIEGCVSTRPWLAKDEDGFFNYGLRMTAEASMSAFAKARFLFVEKKWEHTFFKTGLKVLKVPDNNKNPYVNDPNVFLPSEELPKKVMMHRAGSQYRARHAAPRYRAKEVLSGIDAFSQPTYLGHDGQIAYFNLNNPDDIMDDRLVVRSGSTVTTVDEQSDKPVAAFAAATASGADVSILAMQCMADLGEDFDAGDVSEANQKEAAEATQIVAVVGNGSTMGKARVISEMGKTHMAPKVGIDAAGKAAVVWPSGQMEFVKDEDGNSNGIIQGDFNLSTFDGNEWSEAVSLAKLGEGRQISDYAVAVSGGAPVIMATIPSTDSQGNRTTPVYAITYKPTEVGGSTVFQSLGFNGNSHQVVSLRDGRFVAATKTDADSIGADIILYEGIVRDGALSLKNLGRLGMNQRDITTFRIVTPKGGTNSIADLSIVWNQHDIQVTDVQNNKARGYNSCYAARIRTAGGLGISHPVLIYELTDEDNVASIDAYSSGEDEVTSLICVTGAGAEASTGAYVLQSDVKLINQINSSQVRLNGNIAKGESAQIDITVMNTGIDPVSTLTARVGESTGTASVSIQPGEVGTVSVPLPIGTDFSRDIAYSVDATFAGPESGAQSTNGFTDAFRMEVADIKARLLGNRLDQADDVVNILASISDNTVCNLSSDYTVKVGIYQDPNGQNLYPGTSVIDIRPADFRLGDGQTRKPVLARFKVKTYENVAGHAYLIVNTVTPEGLVVKDQNQADNSLMVPFDVTTDMGNDDDAIPVLTADDFEHGKLQVTNEGEGIAVANIDTDHDVKVYGVGGQLIRWYQPKTNELHIPDLPRGVILISNGTRAGKILH